MKNDLGDWDAEEAIRRTRLHDELSVKVSNLMVGHQNIDFLFTLANCLAMVFVEVEGPAEKGDKAKEEKIKIMMSDFDKVARLQIERLSKIRQFALAEAEAEEKGKSPARTNSLN